MVLYYEEELKLKTLELGNLRDKNREMESALRELQVRPLTEIFYLLLLGDKS